MKQSWINIKSTYGFRTDAVGCMALLEKKFPHIKFKLGKTRIDPNRYNLNSFPVLLTPIMSLLPTPHPNETARTVVQYALNLSCKTEWFELKDKTKEENVETPRRHHITEQLMD